MIQHLNQLRQEGLGLHEATLLKGAENRFRPDSYDCLNHGVRVDPDITESWNRFRNPKTVGYCGRRWFDYHQHFLL